MVRTGMCLPPTSPCPDVFSGTFFFSLCPPLELLLRLLTLKSGRKEEVRLDKWWKNDDCRTWLSV